MLSYRHAFHAGNFADVLKHATLQLVIDYFCRKSKGFSYIDSHSGAGMYRLLDEYAQKTGEYKNGIEKIIFETDTPESLIDYVTLIKSLNADESLNVYPGSPAIAKHLLRRQDAAHLYELHPNDNQLLTTFCERWRKAFVYKSDGYQGVLAQLPPATRRGIVLIDPPYEIKKDYIHAVNTIIDGYRKFATGCYILWYPVVHRHYINDMQKQFCHSKIKNVIQVEYNQAPDNDAYGMTGTGLFIVNPPWQLAQQLQSILPYLKAKLGDEQTSFQLTQLIEE